MLIDHYLCRATEVDVDALCDGETVFVAGVMEHIEEAGVHSGDSACSMPPYSLQPETIDELKRQTEAMARALDVRGLMNVQFAIEEPHSATTRASMCWKSTRAPAAPCPSWPRPSAQPVAAIAAKVMAGEAAEPASTWHDKPYDHIAVKEAVFPFARFAGVDTVLGPEMRSTGEVMGLDWIARAARPLAAGLRPRLRQEPAGRRRGPARPTGCVFVSVKDADKPWIVEPVQHPAGLGFTHPRHRRHRAATWPSRASRSSWSRRCWKAGRTSSTPMKNGEVQLVFNTTEGKQSLAGQLRDPPHAP